MRSKSVVLLALALGCGLVASIGISQVMERRNQDAGTPGETETIFVALNDINPNEPITAQNVKIEEWPKSKVQSGAITRIEEYENKRARQKIFAGEPLLAAKLINENEVVGASSVIPKGYRAVAVRVDPVSGGGSLILPNDRVDVLVFLSKNPSHGISETQTKTILQDVKVFAVDTVWERSPGNDEPSIAAKTISLLVTPEQAEKLTLATEMGTIRLILRNDGDKELVSADGADTSDVLGTGSGSNRDAEVNRTPVNHQATAAAVSGVATATRSLLDFIKEKQATKATAKTEAGPWSMMVIKGSEIEEMKISSDGLPTIVGEAGTPDPAPPTHDQQEDDSENSSVDDSSDSSIDGAGATSDEEPTSVSLKE